MVIPVNPLRSRKESTFQRYIALEVLNDTTLDSEKVIEYFEDIKNEEFFAQTDDSDEKGFLIAPRNSIIAKPVSAGAGREEGEVNLIMYPFFSSHLCLPVKPGEYVWGFQETDGKAFWVSRIHEADHVEDLNYTHGDRRELPTSLDATAPGSIKDKTITFSSVPGFPNGSDIANRESDKEDPESSTIEDLEKKGINYNSFTLSKINSYDKISKENLCVSSIVYEPVPRFTKRPGDMSIQGSNNASITLGTERGYGSQKRPDPKKNSANPENDESSESGLSEGMGAIDIVVGRGRLHSGAEPEAGLDPSGTRPRVVKNTRDEFETSKNVGLEPGKAPDGSALADGPEGDPDFLHDSARIYMSMKTDSDKVFGLTYPDVAQDEPVESTPENATIVLKSDQIRIVARKDVEKDIQGSIRIIKEGESEADRATVVMQPDGTIMIDGPRIIIGDGREDAEGDNGAGTQVKIGRDATESVVLGDRLGQVLCHFLGAVVNASTNISIGAGPNVLNPQVLMAAQAALTALGGTPSAGTPQVSGENHSPDKNTTLSKVAKTK